MKKLISAAIIAAATGFTATPAMADSPVFYTGLNIGWNASEIELEGSTEANNNTFAGDQTASASGPAGFVINLPFSIWKVARCPFRRFRLPWVTPTSPISVKHSNAGKCLPPLNI